MDKSRKLKSILQEVTRPMDPDGILLSGGLDTAILSWLFRDRPLQAVTVAVGPESPDLAYASKLARLWGWRHAIVRVGFREFLKALPETIRALRSFDPMTLRNNAVIHLGLKRARALKLRRIVTGDGGDELFAGYRFLFEKEPRALTYSLRKMWKIMHFSSQDLGRELGIQILSPYIEPEVRRFAQTLKPRDLVAGANGTRIGKAVLRRAFEGDLNHPFLWRVKQPIQDGSGSAGITAFIEKSIPDAEFSARAQTLLIRDRVRIRDKEQLYCYEIFKKIFGSPRKAGPGETACPDCGARIARPEGKFCGTCGKWPAC